MKDLKARRGRRFIQQLVEQGEHQTQDFKYVINDARKIARSVSAFANNSGGCLLIGVKDNGVIAGVRNEEDIYVVEQAAGLYCHPACHVDFDAFSIDTGVTVIRATIQRAARRPIMVDEGGGTFKAYYRVADENIAAHPLMVEAWRLSESYAEAPVYYTADTISSDILANLADEPVSVECLLRRVHISRRSLEDTLARLAAMNLIEFVFDGTGFSLRRRGG